MTRTTKRLGRGLDSLISDLRGTGASTTVDQSSASGQQTETLQTPIHETPAGRVRNIPPDELHQNPDQPRASVNTYNLSSLVSSIRETGILQPILARINNGRTEIVAGERRWRAAKLAGLTEVPVMIRDIDDREALEFALIENIQREDLNAIDRARAYRQVCERFRLRPEDLAGRIGEDRTTVINYIRLLDLSDDITDLVVAGRLGMGHARCLLGVHDPKLRSRLAQSAAVSGLSVRALEEMVRRDRGPHEPAAAPREQRATPHIRDMQQRFEDAIKTKVTIREGRKKGAGRIVIEYYTLDDFDRIASAMGVDLP